MFSEKQRLALEIMKKDPRVIDLLGSDEKTPEFLEAVQAAMPSSQSKRSYTARVQLQPTDDLNAQGKPYDDFSSSIKKIGAQLKKEIGLPEDTEIGAFAAPNVGAPGNGLRFSFNVFLDKEQLQKLEAYVARIKDHFDGAVNIFLRNSYYDNERISQLASSLLVNDGRRFGYGDKTIWPSSVRIGAQMFLPENLRLIEKVAAAVSEPEKIDEETLQLLRNFNCLSNVGPMQPQGSIGLSCDKGGSDKLVDALNAGLQHPVELNRDPKVHREYRTR